MFKFNVSCYRLGVQYRKTVNRPALIAKMIIDGDMLHPIILDGNFDEDWGDCIYLEHVLSDMAQNEHEITLEIMAKEGACADAQTPFLLYSFFYS